MRSHARSLNPPRARVPYHGRMGISSCDSAAHGCAYQILGSLPTRLRTPARCPSDARATFNGDNELMVRQRFQAAENALVDSGFYNI